MRNIKFRIKHEASGHTSVLYGSNRHMLDMSGNVVENYGDEYRSLWDVVFDSDCTAQLFTGVSDKNGIEIYEGDIIQFEKYPSPYGYGHEDDEPDIIKCEIRWINCGLKACWGHKFCNEERIHSGMEVVFEH